jgi:hypothetical protein
MENEQAADQQIEKVIAKKTCGLVMPISPIDGMSAEHWSDVRVILEQVAMECGFETRLVSAANVSGLLPARIVTNLYLNDIVICDVSGRNPNVMFELGLRLAFDKPTIIIKDDATEYTFDIQSIGHIDYPRSLRINKMEVFKEELKKSINETYQKKIDDPSYSTFLKHYQIYETKGLSESTNFESFVTNQLENLSQEIASLKPAKRTGWGLKTSKGNYNNPDFDPKRLNELARRDFNAFLEVMKKLVMEDLQISPTSPMTDEILDMVAHDMYRHMIKSGIHTDKNIIVKYLSKE